MRPAAAPIMVVVNVNQLIIDYVVICDKFGKVLDFPEFVPFWKLANEIAEARVREEVRKGSTR